jgi:hypothetical protein
MLVVSLSLLQLSIKIIMGSAIDLQQYFRYGIYVCPAVLILFTAYLSQLGFVCYFIII